MAETNEMLDAFFELNKQRIDKILEYRKGGGLERVVETSHELNKLTEEQMRLLELIMNTEDES